MTVKFSLGILCLVYVISAALTPLAPVLATAPNPGGNTTVVKPTDESPVSITEDAVQPETANIRLIVPTLVDPGGGTPNSIRILSVTGGTLWTSAGATITLGSSGSILSLSSSRIDFRFRPDAGRDTNASFDYVVVDPHSSSVNSTASTATIPITAVNDAPVLQTLSGSTGVGLAATYYINSWDLTGATYRRIDSTINFSNNFSVPGLNVENFSARWTGKVKSPITGNVTFSTSTDDGVRLWVNNSLIIDNWTLHGETVDTAAPMSLMANELYDIRMEFYERGGGEVAKLRWAYSGQATQIIPQANLFPAITRPAMTYVNGSGAVVIDDALTVSDVDSATITGGTVEITANYQVSEDALQFTNQNGITGSYSNGVLTLSGTATVATYQAALRTVRYYNSDLTPTTSTRTIEFTVNDGSDDSNSTYRDINFSGINNPPVITEGTSVSVTMDEDGSPTPFSLTLNATDADYHNITWSISGQATHGTAAADGTGDSKAISYTPVADYYGSDSFIVQVSDGAGGTDTITVLVTINDRTPPLLSAISSGTPADTTVTITWTSNENTSTRVSYGVTGSYGTLTSITDTSPRVTAHTRILTGLLPCTTYHFAVISADAGGNSATSGDNSFITAGCAGNATPSSHQTTSVDVATGGTSTLTSGTSSITVTTPENFTDEASSVVIQVKAVDGPTVLQHTGRPSAVPLEVGSAVFDVKAIINNTTVLDSFDAPVTIDYHYEDTDVTDINEDSLWLYHYHNDTWDLLDNCQLDTSANTISCTTKSFSIFALFGKAPTKSGGTTLFSLGCGDMKALNYKPNVIHTPAWCEYEKVAVVETPLPVVTNEPVPQSVTVLPLRFTQDLAVGSVHKEVLELQKILNQCGFKVAATGPGSPGKETATFGAATKQAVIKFQVSRNLKPALGVINAVTRAELNKNNCLSPKTLQTPAPKKTSDVRDLYVTLTGEDVRQLQKILIEKNVGPKARELKRVTATGLFSSYTYNALIEYQAKYSINPPSGYFGIKTRIQMKAAGIPGIWW